MRRTSGLLASIAALLLPSTGHAAFHIAHISEIMVGAAGDPNIQYVEIRMDSPLPQNAVATTRLTTFSCDGTTKTVILNVPGNVPNAMNGQHWIMASPSGSAFLAASGINPDFTWDSTALGNGIPTPCGQVCWGAPGLSAPAPTWDMTVPNNYVDCIAYGGYMGPTKTADPDNDLVSSSDGTPSTSPPGDGTFSLTRITSTNNNIADVTLTCPSPTNDNGDMGTFGACTPPTTTTTFASASTTTLVGTGTTTTTLPGTVGRSKCTARKVAAAGKKAAAKAACEAAAAAKGTTPKDSCAAHAEKAFARAWKKAETKKDCLAPTGDRDAVETAVDAFVGRLAGALRTSSQPSKCTSRKLRAAGAKAAARAACDARAFAKGVSVDARCLATAASKFAAAFTKAEKRRDCQAGTGDAARIEQEADASIAAVVSRLAP